MAKKTEIEKKTEVVEIPTNKITKAMLDERIERGDFRLVKGFSFRDGGKELKVDYKDVDRNYFINDNPLINHFKELHPHQEFIILE